MGFLRLLLPFISFLLAPALVSAQQEAGLPFIKQFRSSDFKAPDQICTGTAAPDDRVLFGTSGVLLVFDGQEFQAIPTPGNRTLRTVKALPDGNTYWGTSSDFGRLDISPEGKFSFVSFADSLPESQRKFGSVFSISGSKNSIWFRSGKNLFFWNGKEIRRIRKQGNIDVLMQIGTGIYGSEDQRGLFRLQDTVSVVLPGTLDLSKDYVTALLPFQNGKILTVAEKGGLQIYDPVTGKLSLLPDGRHKPMIDGRIYGGLRHTNGHFLIWTLAAGIFEFSESGIFIRQLTESQGLPGNNIKHVFEDPAGNLWATTETGIAYLEYASPVSVFDSRSGIKGIVHAVQRHNGILYAGTGDGLFMLHPGNSNSGGLAFSEKIPGLQAQVFGFTPYQNQLLAATGDGIFRIYPTWKKLNPARSSVLFPVPGKPGLFLAGTLGGAGLLDLTRQKGPVLKPLKSPPDIRSFSVAGSGSYWVGTHSNGLFKLDLTLSPGDTSSTLSQPDSSSWFTEGTVFTGDSGPAPLFSTSQGIWHWKDGRFIPAVFSGFNPDAPVLSSALFRYLHSGTLLLVAEQDSIFGENLLLTGPDPFHGNLQRLNGNLFKSIFEEPDGTLWIGTQGQLFRVVPGSGSLRETPFRVLFREIRTGAGLRLPLSDTLETHPELDWDGNELTFRISARDYTTSDGVQFRYRLETSGTGWSSWTSSREIRFSNLWPGNYTLVAQARSASGKLSIPAEYRFTIRNPWYFSWLFILLWILLFIGLTAGFVRLKTLRLQRKNRDLEQKVLDKTRELLLHEKMAAVGRISGGLAHEINNALAIISSNLYLVRTYLSVQPGRKKPDLGVEELNDIDTAIRGAETGSYRIQEIIESLKKAANPHQTEKAFIQVDPTIRTIIDLYLQPDPKTEIQVSGGVQSKLGCNPGLFSLAIFNLLHNALDALNSYRKKIGDPGFAGQVLVETRTEPLKPGFLIIRISDNGPGIPAEYHNRVFDPFFTTKEVGSGRGLGLYEVYAIINGMGGRITLEPEEGRGTVFTLELPFQKP